MHLHLSRVSGPFLRILLIPESKIPRSVRDRFLLLQSTPLRVLKMMSRRVQTPLQQIREYACVKFELSAAANAQGNQFHRLALNYPGLYSVGFAILGLNGHIQMKSTGGSYNVSQMGIGTGNAEEDPTPNQGDMNYRNVSKIHRKCTCLGPDLATIIGSSSCRVSFAVSLLFTKAESGRFLLSPGKVGLSASTVFR